MRIKNAKSLLALVLAVVFLFTMLPVVSFAANGDLGTVFDGSSTAFYSTDGTMTVVSTESLGKGGKALTDAYYVFSTKSTASTAYVQPHTNQGNNGQMVLEAQFMLPEGSNGIALRTQFWDINGSGGTGNTTRIFKITPNGFSVPEYSDDLANDAVIPGTSFEANKWYTMAIEFPGATDTEAYSRYLSLYINGKLVDTVNYEISNDYVYVRGTRRIQMYPVSGTAGDPYIYMDNINFYQGRYNPATDAAATLTALNDNVVIANDAIAYKSDITVDQLKSSVAKADGVSFNVYNASGALAADSDVVNANMKAVVNSVNGRTISYYALRENVYVYGSDLYDGTVNLGWGGGSVAIDYTKNLAGIGGKAADDVIYSINNDTSSNPFLSMGNGPQNRNGREAVEFSMYIPSGSAGAYLETGLITSPEKQYYYKPFYFRPSGVYSGSAISESSKLTSLSPDTWYNMAIVYPGPVEFASDGTPTAYNRNVELYINGVKKAQLNGNTTSGGVTYEAVAFNNFRLNGANTGSQQTNYYLDNLRRITIPYNPAYDVAPVVTASNTTHRFEDGKFVLESSPTVAQFLEGISANKMTFRVIDANGQTMADSAKISNDTCRLVAITKNGTNIERAFTYYNIIHDKFSYELNVLRDGVPAANFYDNTSTLTFGATFNNYDGNTYKPTLYVALYKDSTLEKVWTDSATLTEVGTTAELSVNVADMPAQREGTSIKVMLVDGSDLEPYTVAKNLRYGYADTPTTLYIIGDSIAQTYEINAPGETASGKSPFIQGWGYHIASYLNNNVTVDNRARSGWDTDRFLYPTGICTKEDSQWYNEALMTLDYSSTPDVNESVQKIVPENERYKCWPAIKEVIQPGDYLMIALGINDAGSANVPDGRFEENLTVLCQEAQAKGATVIFSTPTINGGKWTEEWSFKEEPTYRGSIMAKVAADNNAVCLPTGATLATLYNKLYNDYSAANPGATTLQKKQYVRAQFHRYDAVFNTPVEEGGYGYTNISGLNDHQHYADKGAYKVAGIIADLIVKSGSTLGDYVVVPQ